MDQERIDQLIQEADAHYLRGDLKEALTLYRQVLVQDETVAWAHSRIGAILAEFGHHAEAEASIHRALELDPDLPQAHSNLGNIYYTRGDYENALLQYQEAIRLDPHQPVYYENLHAAYKKLGRISEAVAALKKAQRLHEAKAREEARAHLKQTAARLRRGGCLGAATFMALLTALFLVFTLW